MKKFLAVYNMKSNRFFAPTIISVEEFLKSDDFISVGTVTANSADDVYRILNFVSDIPTEESKAVSAFVHKLGGDDPFFTKYPSLHTSMSCGDVLIEYTPEGKVYHMCDSCGWTVMK